MGILTYKIAIIMVFFLALTSSGCKKQEIHLKKTNFTGGNLRIDGYYYSDEADSSKISSRVFFYQNGITLFWGGYSLSNNSEFLQSLSDPNAIKSKQQSQTGWGVFIVEKETFKYEIYSSSESGAPFVMEGVILNDTTIHFTQYYRLNKNNKKKDEKQISEIYRFVEFLPKPDSTNNFVP